MNMAQFVTQTKGVSFDAEQTAVLSQVLAAAAYSMRANAERLRGKGEEQGAESSEAMANAAFAFFTHLVEESGFSSQDAADIMNGLGLEALADMRESEGIVLN